MCGGGKILYMFIYIVCRSILIAKVELELRMSSDIIYLHINMEFSYDLDQLTMNNKSTTLFYRKESNVKPAKFVNVFSNTRTLLNGKSRITSGFSNRTTLLENLGILPVLVEPQIP